MISGMARTSLAVELSAADQTRLQQWQSAHGTPQQVALRCRLVLAAAARTAGLGHRFCLRSQPPYRRTVTGASPGKRDRHGLGDSRPVEVVNRSMTWPEVRRADCRHLADQAQGA